MSSWRAKEDLGTQLVAKVHQAMRFSDQYTMDVGRGFTYWPSDYALTVKADVGNFHNAYTVFRVHSEIEIAKGNGNPASVEVQLAQRMSRASLSAMTYDPEHDRYTANCSVYLHTDNAAWLDRLFVGAVGLQVARVHTLGREIATDLGLEPLMTHHPHHGRRTPPDPTVHAIQQFFQPYGQHASKWDGSPEWHEARDNIRRMANAVLTDDHRNLTASFDWLKDNPIELTVTLERPHPELGNGLFFTLWVPWANDERSVAHTAFALNSMERAEWNWCHDLGSWADDQGELRFNCFVPNICYSPGLLPEMVHDMALRAKWMNETAALRVMGVT